MDNEMIKTFTDVVREIKNEKVLKSVLDDLDIAYCEAEDRKEFQNTYEIYKFIILKFLKGRNI